MSVNHSARSGGILGISFLLQYEGMLCMPHLGDSNVYSQYTIFNMKKKITLHYTESAAIEFFPRD